jgi:His-Xaa-Ser system radical SAM maturase HxsC
MLLKTKGIPLNIDKHVVGKVTRNSAHIDDKTFYISDDSTTTNIKVLECLGILTTRQEWSDYGNQKVVFKIPALEHLQDGDIVSVGNDGNINTLYRINSKQNTLLTTERCNSNCLMCSQPPKDKNDLSLLYDINTQLIPLIPKDCSELGISGGEPTLMGERFFLLLEQISSTLPNTEIHILSNGRAFAWNHMAEKLSSIDSTRLMLGIPLYSDFYQTHDYIVQAENAFYQTVLGLHNLARYNQRIEIRVVLHKQTIPRLVKLSKYIYKNFPFVEHVAFMGLEYIGYTPSNKEKLWVDPFDYKETLAEAVLYLESQGMHVSIYNTPLCVLPEKIWPFSRKSISDWKNEYLPECKNCSKLNDCGGFFTWNLKKLSSHIKQIQ